MSEDAGAEDDPWTLSAERRARSRAAATTDPPPDAVGRPGTTDEPLREGFADPPDGYGEVGFYWWQGDPLERDRMAWHLDRLDEVGDTVSGLQVNYAHSDEGGQSFGLTYDSDPPLFSEDWWDLYGWFLEAAADRGVSVSLSDYTLGAPGQGWWADEIREAHPEMRGRTLTHAERRVEGQTTLDWTVPDRTVSVVAYRTRDGDVVPDSGVDLRDHLSEGTVTWDAPEGDWRVVAVHVEVHECSLDPLDPRCGEAVIDRFFGRFEERFPDAAGDALNFFFSDELDFGVEGTLWHDRLPAAFRERTGYDLLPALPLLFVDAGPRTPKVRLDYHDVVVSLVEESYFRPVYEFHEERGMLFGCDHGGRGKDVTEFGDYFRTGRWHQAPGNDQPFLESDVVKNKVNSSIGDLYRRPRTWLEGYHSSGWDTSLADLADATFRNFVMGQNVLSLHGLYYSTHGSWWEWAPPSNHFRNPYWEQMGEFLACTERLSYLLSRGVHRCDVAVLYPVAPSQAGVEGEAAVEAAFEVGERLYGRGVDFDYVDFESLARADVEGGELRVAGERYQALVLPHSRVVRAPTLGAARDLYRDGGTVVALGALPEASDRAGRDDPALDALVRAVFGRAADESEVDGRHDQRNDAGGLGATVPDPGDVVDVVTERIPRDFVCRADDCGVDAADTTTEQPLVHHRRVEDRDVYAVYGAPAGAECVFRARGDVERWDPWTGETSAVHAVTRTDEGTVVEMPGGADEVQVLVFGPAESEPTVAETDLAEVTDVTDDGATVTGVPAATGEQTATLRREHGETTTVSGRASRTAATVAIDGPWTTRVEPTLDNRWGDFRLPADDDRIGPEARRFRYAPEPADATPDWADPALDDADWDTARPGVGPRFWRLGPFPDDADLDAVAADLATRDAVDPDAPVAVGDAVYEWEPLDFSWRRGVPDDPGHQGYHGLKGEVGDDLIALGEREETMTGSRYVPESGGSRYLLWTTVRSPEAQRARLAVGGLAPESVWVGGERHDPDADEVAVGAGATPVLVRYDDPGRGHVVFLGADGPTDPEAETPLATTWYDDPGVLPFDCRPAEDATAGWYRFGAPPGLEGLTVTAHGDLSAWVDGRAVAADACGEGAEGATRYRVALDEPVADPATVALRVRQPDGRYGGAALPEPVRFDCGRGRLSAGDWSAVDGLATYSGAVRYERPVTVDAETLRGAGRVTLDLGEVVASATVEVNGERAGTAASPPWTVDVTDHVEPGENRLAVTAYSTLANHYDTVPTRYGGDTTAGLLGPVELRVEYPVELDDDGTDRT